MLDITCGAPSAGVLKPTVLYSRISRPSDKSEWRGKRPEKWRSLATALVGMAEIPDERTLLFKKNY
jgi:hypothetical protein